MARPGGSDATSRFRAEVEDPKAEMKSSAEIVATSKRPLKQESVFLQEKLKLLPPPGQEESEWMVNFKYLEHFKSGRDNNWAILETGLSCWVVHQRQQLHDKEGKNKRRRIDLLNSIDFNWGDGHPFSKQNHGTNLRSD